jgi:hypothetical protein
MLEIASEQPYRNIFTHNDYELHQFYMAMLSEEERVCSKSEQGSHVTARHRYPWGNNIDVSIHDVDVDADADADAECLS